MGCNKCLKYKKLRIIALAKIHKKENPDKTVIVYKNKAGYYNYCEKEFALPGYEIIMEL